MSFDTPGYVLFLCAAVLLYRVCPRCFRWALLLAASLFFYACWSPPLTLVILGVVGLTYGCGLGIEKARERKRKKVWLFTAAAGCAGLLIWFKYFNFLASALYGMFGSTWTPWSILLPVGCSFYTFQALSYVIDVYRGRLPAVRHPGHYALYICFFPQLVAGPIERADALLPQLTAAQNPARTDTVRGLKLLLSGYFRKLVIADLAAPVVNRVFAAANPDGSAVLLAAVLFSFQIYCDFAGYSEIAQGSAYLLGIRLRRNFDRPYLASTMRAFWRRWHMSLTAWFTDYVYIPLGGSRQGKGRQVAAGGVPAQRIVARGKLDVRAVGAVARAALRRGNPAEPERGKGLVCDRRPGAAFLGHVPGAERGAGNDPVQRFVFTVECSGRTGVAAIGWG